MQSYWDIGLQSFYNSGVSVLFSKPSKSLQKYQNQVKVIAIYSYNYIHEIDKVFIISIMFTPYTILLMFTQYIGAL